MCVAISAAWAHVSDDDWFSGPSDRVARLWEKIIITIILVNIEIQTIIFEFENMMHLFRIKKIIIITL